MASSREQENTDKLQYNLYEDFHLMTAFSPPPLAPPTNLPKYSIAMNCFSFLKKEEENNNESQKSYHVVDTALKNDKKYFIKHNKTQSFMSELELTCWMWYRLTIRKLVPNKAYACYDDNFNFTGIASQEIPGFESNHVNSLQEKDLTIDAVEHDFNYQRNHLIEILKPLSKCLNRPICGEGLFYSLWNYTKQSYNTYCNSAPTASQVQWYCDQFLKFETDFSLDKLCDLIKILAARQAHIKNLPTSEQYLIEHNLLDEGIKCAQLLMPLTKKDKVDIKKLEAIDQHIQQHFTSLPTSEDKISIIINQEPIDIFANDLKNYRLIKGLAEGMVTSYVNAENDYHSKNGSKLGQRIDFDMSEWEFLSHFKPCNSLEWLCNGIKDNCLLDLLNWNKSTNKDPFIFTERDIRNFPDLQDAYFRYWPTKSDLVSTSGLKIIPSIFENFYTTENSEIFKKLKINPVFIFFKYKTFLKSILITEDMIRESAALCIRNDITMPNSTETVLNELIIYKLNRLKKLKKVLLNMSEFKDFLVKNKDFVFQLIKEELIEDIQVYKDEMKAEGNQHNRKLINAINLTAIETEFQQILAHFNIEAGLNLTSSEHDEQPITASLKI